MVFSSKTFQVSGLTLKSLMHFELICVQGERLGLASVFYDGDPVFLGPVVEGLSLLHRRFAACLSRIKCLQSCGLISGSSALFHWFIVSFYNTMILLG
jgi:hypothetical protein